MPAYRETPAPPAGPLQAQYQDVRGRIHGWRPKGTKDWLLLYTELGECLIRFAGGQFKAGPGDVILFKPGTPQDYGQHNPAGKWRNLWVHWVPRLEIIPWLAWPELSPGVRHLRLPPELRGAVLKELIFADSVLRAGLPYGEFLALNGVERALLFCNRANPRTGDLRWNPRIQQAVDHLARNLREHHLLGNLARRFGFSRSRFASLFRRQVGQPPGHYLEVQRLTQARHLLAYTNQTLAQIADQTGFSSPFYLSIRFKKHHGQSPRTFRQQRQR
ncbi:MAG: helix-turn-helix domain-containing protein [Methylacidiphilales bacterium]|nr:helix-turn-helix domain-containing protein [Candidatus Methylacidiphilales bacterium]